MEAIPAVCLMIAAKLEEIYPISFKDLEKAVKETNNAQMLKETEIEVLNVRFPH